MHTERFHELRNRDAGTTGKTTEEISLWRGGQSLGSPETGRKRHQRDSGRKLRRGGNRLDVFMPGRRRCPRKLTSHFHLSFQNESPPIVRNDRTRIEVPIRGFSASPILVRGERHRVAKRQDGTLAFGQGCQSNPKQSEFGQWLFMSVLWDEMTLAARYTVRSGTPFWTAAFNLESGCPLRGNSPPR